MSLPRLTIVTPSLNQAAYLERTIRSVLDQAYPDLEYMVVDGGSTDGSVAIIERYADRLAWWTSEPDRGQSHAINKAISRATGDVVAYVNSDDYYLPGAFAAALPLFADPGVAWVSGACRFLFADGTVETVWRPRPPKNRRLNWVLDPWSVPQASSFWRRDLFERVGLFTEDLHYVFDTEFMLRLAIDGVLPHFLDRELAVRFLHEEAKSADRSRFEREGRTMERLLVPRLRPSERAAYRLGYRHWNMLARRALWRARLALRRERKS